MSQDRTSPTASEPLRVLRAALLSLSLVACGTTTPLLPLPAEPPEDLLATVYLVGDGGGVAHEDPVLTRLQEDVSRSRRGGPVLVAFLGDNVYRAGVRRGEPTHSRDTLILSRQLRAVARGGGGALFVPGNHDWADGGEDGLESVQLQERFFRQAAGAGAAVTWAPGGGCPGPAVLDLPGVRVVSLDSQWFLHEYARGCPGRTREQFVAQVAAVVDAAGEREVLVLSHHPLATNGPHGGYFPLDRHLFPLRDFESWAFVPLPVLGSLYVAARNRGVHPQDVSSDGYQAMREILLEALGSARRLPLLHGAGHEHSLQVLDGGSQGASYHLVSGSATSTTPVDTGNGALFAASLRGYMRLEFTASRVRLTVLPLPEDGSPGAREGWCGVVVRETRALDPCG